MSLMLDDYVCDRCGKTTQGWNDEDHICCERIMRREFGGCKTYEPRGEICDLTLPGTGRFNSRSDMRSYMKRNGYEERGDKVGGARNEDHRNLGKLFSYSGAPTKRSELF